MCRCFPTIGELPLGDIVPRILSTQTEFEGCNANETDEVNIKVFSHCPSIFLCPFYLPVDSDCTW